MKKNYFKYLLFTDLHIGKNSFTKFWFEQDIKFIDWLCKIKADKIVFLGDLIDNRNYITLEGLNVLKNILDKLNFLNIPIYMLIGNHDMFYKNNKEITIYNIIENKYNNIHIIKYPTILDNKITLIPWLLEDETIIKNKYYFGHLEIANINLNEKYYSKGISKKQFSNSYVYSGHFHNRIIENNITYIGAPYAFNFGNKNKDDFGVTIVEIGDNHFKDYFIPYKNGVRFLEIEYNNKMILKNDYSNTFIKIKSDKEINGLLEKFYEKKAINVIVKYINKEEKKEKNIKIIDPIKFIYKYIDEYIEEEKRKRLKNKIDKILRG